MGQAQLLLIVLGVVLVGVAIIAGIQAYDSNNRKASVDALTHDAFRIGSDWQLWAQKPAQFGGPAATITAPVDRLAALTTLQVLGYANALTTTNTNGTCTVVPAAQTISCANATLGTQAVVTLTGVADTQINLTSTTMGT